MAGWERKIIDGQMKKIDGWLDGQEKNRWLDVQKKIYGYLDGYTLIYEIIYGWLDGYINNTNQMNGWIEKK